MNVDGAYIAKLHDGRERAEGEVARLHRELGEARAHRFALLILLGIALVGWGLS